LQFVWWELPDSVRFSWLPKKPEVGVTPISLPKLLTLKAGDEERMLCSSNLQI